MTIDLVDATITALLIGTVGYAFLLDRRVRALMAALQGLEPAVRAFAQAADRTEDTVMRLRTDPPVAAHAHEPFRTTRQADRDRRPGQRGPSDHPVVETTAKADLIRRFFDAAPSNGAGSGR
ncbi:hypothetical protein JQC91_05045 [Jannaschia sp. Os4]|uniref:hypothetical protein n=1 Tax=Jannaschia sp. Os4 TaxID=2807617 RepID=UPI00193AC300|nr:hypothetical protein [Jannaschia sp. Os4]MBM2575665.1 hypothetical protein [Jannaschia sp. Os4]